MVRSVVKAVVGRAPSVEQDAARASKVVSDPFVEGLGGVFEVEAPAKIEVWMGWDMGGVVLSGVVGWCCRVGCEV